MAEIIARAGLPGGVFNLVMGAGASVGNSLVAARGVDPISLTGSVPVGRRIAAASIANLPKLQMEMGSKKPMVSMNDCDLDLAVAHAAGAAFGGTGQKCTAASRLIVYEKIHDAVAEKLVAAAQFLRVGHALDTATQIGYVVSEGQLEQNLRYVETGRAKGADLLCGGTRLERETKGYFMAPTVFGATQNTLTINREEMFATNTCLQKVSSYAEALDVANDSEFGLSAGIMIKSRARANHFRANARAGCVMVNLRTAGTDYHVPFGERGASSHGPREQGRYAAEFYTRRSRPLTPLRVFQNDSADRWVARCQLVQADLSPTARRRR